MRPLDHVTPSFDAAGSRGVNLSPVRIVDRETALIWRYCDDLKTALEVESDEVSYLARAAEIGRRFERDYFGIRAREEIALFEAERTERLRQILIETNPDRIETAAA